MEEKWKKHTAEEFIQSITYGILMGMMIGAFPACICNSMYGDVGGMILAVCAALGAVLGIIICCQDNRNTEKHNKEVDLKNAELLKAREEQRQKEAREYAKEEEYRRRYQEEKQVKERKRQEDYAESLRVKNGKNTAYNVMMNMLRGREFRTYEELQKHIVEIPEEFRGYGKNALEEFKLGFRKQIESYSLMPGGLLIGEREGERLRIMAQDMHFMSVITQDSHWEELSILAQKHTKEFEERMYAAVLDRDCYGKENTEYIHRLQELTTAHFDSFYNRFKNSRGLELLDIEIEKIVQYLWFFAFAKTYDSLRFEQVKEMYNLYNEIPIENKYKEICIVSGLNVVLAELYVAKSLGDSVLKEKWRELNYWLSYYIEQKNVTACENLASGAMWMKAYELEREILRSMVLAGLPMDAEKQERLRQLDNGGSQKVSVKEAEIQAKGLVFNYASVNWSNEELNTFFQGLIQEGRKLNYSLAIREWSKSQPVTMGAGKIELQEVMQFVEHMIAEEYDGAIICKKQRCTILVDEKQEEMEGILLSPVKNEIGFSHMALWVNLMKLGRNLNVRIYTLFVPEEGTIEKQEQLAVSMKRNINPNVVAFEESLRESVLQELTGYINEKIVQKPIPVMTGADAEEQEEQIY